VRVRFHHLGVACRQIDAEQEAWVALGYRPERAEFTDPLQGVRGRFLVGPGPRLELLEAVEGSTVLEPWLVRGVKVYHHAYEVDALEAAIDDLRDRRGRLVSGPVPAVAFDRRPVAFLAMPNRYLVELISAQPVSVGTDAGVVIAGTGSAP